MKDHPTIKSIDEIPVKYLKEALSLKSSTIKKY